VIRYWEDVVVGERCRSTDIFVSESDIVQFAEVFDPMPIHVNNEAAEQGPFGEITASGAHMFSLRQRLVHDFELSDAVIASLGVDEVRYVSALRPDRVCHLEIEFAEKTPSRSKPDRGVVVLDMELFADGETVMSLKDIVLMRRLPT